MMPLSQGLMAQDNVAPLLRILAIQDEVYEKTIKMLSGATEKINIGSS